MHADDERRGCACRSGAEQRLVGLQAARPTPLERRAFADLAFGTRCTAADVLACCDRCWSRWVRERTMEHLFGRHYWDELDRGDFALLRGEVHPDRVLVSEVVAAIATGRENLDVIMWAFEAGRPLDDVLAVLATIDVNAHRLPRFRWLRRVVHRDEPIGADARQPRTDF
jgi:hypothetical protein